MDTEIGLYDALGILITSDDDDNGDDPFTILYSLLTFGDGDPLGTTVDSIAGEDGTLVAGAYTLVVGGFSTDFTQDINDITGGTSAGVIDGVRARIFAAVYSGQNVQPGPYL